MGEEAFEYFGIVLSGKEGCLKFGNNDFERDLGKVYVREGKKFCDFEMHCSVWLREMVLGLSYARLYYRCRDDRII